MNVDKILEEKENAESLAEVKKNQTMEPRTTIFRKFPLQRPC